MIIHCLYRFMLRVLLFSNIIVSGAVTIPDEFKQQSLAQVEKRSDLYTLRDATERLTHMGVNTRVLNHIQNGSDGVYIYLAEKEQLHSLTPDKLKGLIPAQVTINKNDYFEVSVVTNSARELLEAPEFKIKRRLEFSSGITIETVLNQIIDVFGVPIALVPLSSYAGSVLDSDIVIDERNALEALNVLLPHFHVQSYKLDVYTEESKMVFGVLYCF